MEGVNARPNGRREAVERSPRAFLRVCAVQAFDAPPELPRNSIAQKEWRRVAPSDPVFVVEAKGHEFPRNSS
jgi:hypothetical protein